MASLPVTNAVFGLGVAAGAYLAARSAVWFFSLIQTAVAIATKPALRKYGRWAVVTGATDGIGKAYAKQLLKAGLDVILVSRTQSKLDATAAELAAKYPAREIKTIAFDFTVTVESGAYDGLKTRIAELTGGDLGVLVNNVGVSYPGALYYSELETYAPGLSREIVHVNIDSVYQLSTLALALFNAKASRKGPRGAIVNISSASGRVPIGEPLCAAYSGTKACVDYFSRSLAHECAPSGVVVQCQSPYFVTTKMAKIRHASLTVPSPDTWAAAAAAAIRPNAASVVPYWPHAVQDWLIHALPEWALDAYLMTMRKGLRRAFLKKHAEKQAGGAGAAASAEQPASQGGKKRE